MARIAKKIVRFVLVVLLFEFLSASFFTTPESSSREDISYDVHQSSLLLPAFLKEEKEKEHFLISFSRLNIFTPVGISPLVRMSKTKKFFSLTESRDLHYFVRCEFDPTLYKPYAKRKFNCTRSLFQRRI